MKKTKINRKRANGSNDQYRKKFKGFIICITNNNYEYEKPPVYSE